MGVSYRARIVDTELAARLEATGAVLIEGPRGCGRTETARRAARSEVRLDTDDEARSAALVAPAILLDEEKPRLIDEWQLVPARACRGDGAAAPARHWTGVAYRI